MIDALKKTARTLLDAAGQKGADEAQVVANHRVVTRVVYEKNDFNISTANTFSEFGLKVHKDQRKGSAASNETSPAALADAAERALTLARFSVADEHLVIPEPQSPDELPGRYDDALVELPAAELHQLAAAFVAAAKAEPRLSLDGGELDLTSVHQVVANSKGLEVSDRVTKLSWALMGMGKTEDEVTSFDYLSGMSWGWDGAAGRIDETAKKLVAKLMATFGARKGESYKGRVLLSPAALGSILFGPIGFQISGQQIMDGKSRWEHSLGEQVASKNFTLKDNPFDLALGGAGPYDGEGVAVREWTIIDQGVLKTHIDSTYTAKRRGTRSTGHAGGLHAVTLEAGDHSYEQLLTMGDRLVRVERFSGNVDPVTGDFSGVAKGSHFYENGEHQYPLTETMIAGNVFELLKNIVALSDRSEPFCNAYRTPWVLVDGVSVTTG